MSRKDPVARAAYERERQAKRRRPERLKAEMSSRPFVAIDSEGGNFGPSFTAPAGVEQNSESAAETKVYYPHKSFLWGAGDVDGNVDWLYSPKPLGTVQILEWLMKLKAAYPLVIFVSFSFGYDIGQLVADLPYEKAWELQHGKPYAKKDDKDYHQRSGRVVYWGRWGLKYLKGKELHVYYYPSGTPHGRTDTRKCKSIRIYDVFGFFQSSFLNAIRTMPGAASPAEYAIIEKGKLARGEFDHSKLEQMKEYTTHELIVLCRMMTMLREAMAKQDIKPISWYGAGSLAQALLKRENIKKHFYEVKGENADEAQLWAHRAFFGGRIELIKQGATRDKLYGYDIASAYPYAATLLSSMEGGAFVRRSSTSIRHFDRLSLVRLRATFPSDLPFYPLPYRTSRGSIYFPMQTHGIYLVDEAIAAIEFVEKFGGSISIEDCLEFIPANDLKPFAFVQELFDFRTSLARDDITGKVVKLAINAVYGKLAQAVGDLGKPPTLACPWYAAAITATTRSHLLRAAMLDPEAIIMLATDGIMSTRRLPLEVPNRKTLGSWEAAEAPQGGVFIQSGVYTFADEKGVWKAHSRGFRPSNVDGSIGEFLKTTIPAQWRKRASFFPFPYRDYSTLGGATVTRDRWKTVGHWIEATRDLKLDQPGAKRSLVTPPMCARSHWLQSRCRTLIDTTPSERVIMEYEGIDGEPGLPLSYPHQPDWLDENFGFRVRDEDDQNEIAAGF